jgi:hypothetical protein
LAVAARGQCELVVRVLSLAGVFIIFSMGKPPVATKRQTSSAARARKPMRSDDHHVLCWFSSKSRIRAVSQLRAYARAPPRLSVLASAIR